jgi:hypothetical protein
VTLIPRQRGLRWITWVAAVALVVVGVVLIVMGLHGPRQGPSIPGPIGKTSVSMAGLTTVATSAPSRSVAADVVGLASYGVGVAPTVTNPMAPVLASHSAHVAFVNRSTPVHLSIPAIHVSTKLTQLRLLASGTVQLPSSYYVPGWYKDGPAPGQKGSAVILGHVDSLAGPGVFYRLNDLRVGNRVVVTLKDSIKVTFAVIGLREYQKNKFPEKLVYGPRSYGALQLVTCGGTFDAKAGHYLSNIVVFTSMVKS